MNIDPAAILAVISGQAEQIAQLEAENEHLRALIQELQEATTEADSRFRES